MSDQNKKNQTLLSFDLKENVHLKKVLFLVAIFIAVLLLLWLIQSDRNKKEKPLENETFEVEERAPKLKTRIDANAVAHEEPEKSYLASEMEIKMAEEFMQKRLKAPLMLVNQNTSENTSNNKNNAIEVAQAESFKNLNTVIAQGHLIHATLESSIHSDLEGFVRAVVSKPVYSENGQHILIPAGSRLVGQYQGNVQFGQTRILITWNRVITSKGLSLLLTSPSVDPLGASGQGADKIHHHFLKQFAQSSLLSIIGVGTHAANLDQSEEYTLKKAYQGALANSFLNSANQSFKQSQLPPTLRIYQGASIHVFVAKDLQFSALKP